jgi:hypothetical protein
MIINPGDLSVLNSQNIFLAYKGLKDKNIVFLGSCRMIPLMFYMSQMFSEYNIFGIYVPYWTNTDSLSKHTIQQILDKTDYLITETTRNYGILNTDKMKENNFFDTFDIKAKEIRITNLELHMYIHDIINTYGVPIHKSMEHFQNSKLKLQSSLINKNQKFIWDFIENNLQSLKLFATHNHPCRILSILTFIFICNIIHIDLSIDFIKKISQYDFLEGNSTPITQLDIDRYGFTFDTKIFDNDIINEPALLYNPTEEEKSLNYSTIENMLSYIKNI